MDDLSEHQPIRQGLLVQAKVEECFDGKRQWRWLTESEAHIGEGRCASVAPNAWGGGGRHGEG